jgi:hypothetical protein
MEVSLRGFGLGATSASGVDFTDTGAGLTPDNFASSCCNGPGGGFGSSYLAGVFGIGSSDCQAFFTANAALFPTALGSVNPCPGNSAVAAAQGAGNAVTGAASAIGGAAGSVLATAAQAAGAGLGGAAVGAGAYTIPILLAAGLILYIVLKR